MRQPSYLVARPKPRTRTAKFGFKKKGENASQVCIYTIERLGSPFFFFSQTVDEDMLLSFRLTHPPFPFRLSAEIRQCQAQPTSCTGPAARSHGNGCNAIGYGVALCRRPSDWKGIYACTVCFSGSPERKEHAWPSLWYTAQTG